MLTSVLYLLIVQMGGVAQVAQVAASIPTLWRILG
jgi:hypothetical protein